MNDLFDALLSRLELEVSPAWGETFAAGPEIDVPGHRRTQKLVKQFGESVVRRAFETALEAKIAPTSSNAMPLMLTLCRKAKGDTDAHAG